MNERATVDITINYRDSSPDLHVAGNWSHHSLRIATQPLGRVALIGDIFADESAINTTAQRALAENNPAAFSDIPGKFATILIGEDGRTTARSSLAGTPTLYYRPRTDGLDISTSPCNLTSHAQPRRTHIAAQLLSPGTESNIFFGNEACYESVYRLHGGQELQSGRSSYSVVTYNSLAAQKDGDFEDSARAVGLAIRRAITSRTDATSRISSDFSGGVDSSSLAYLAAQDMYKLPVFFAGREDVDQGDLRYMQQFAALYPTLEPHIIDTSNNKSRYDLADILSLPRSEELGQAVNGTPYGIDFIQSYYSAIGAHGSSLHLTGNAGDEIGKVGPFYLTDLIQKRRYLDVNKHVFAWSRLYNVSPLALFMHAAKLSGRWQTNYADIAASLRGGEANQRLQMLSVFTPHQPVGPSLKWLHNDIRQELADIFDDKSRQPPELSLTDHMIREGILCTGQTDAANKFYAQQLGVGFVPQSPFLDDAVIKAVLSLPAYKRASYGDFKPIIRAGLQGYVPDEILGRRSKGSYDEAYARILGNSAAAIRNLMNDSYLADMGIIDATKVRSSIDNVETLNLSSIWALERIITTECWARSATSKPELGSQVALPTKEMPEANAPKELFALGENIYTAMSPEGRVVAFNTHTNEYIPLDKTQSLILALLAETNDKEKTLERLRLRYSSTNPKVIQNDVDSTVKKLAEKGVIVQAAQTQTSTIAQKPTRFRSTEFSATREYKKPDASPLQVVLALGALTLDRALLRKKADKRLALLRTLQKRWCTKDATYEQAQNTQMIVQSLPILGRVACAEASYTAALTSAVMRRRVDYHQGVSFGPMAFHAWNEVDGVPVKTPLDGQVLGSYQSFFR